MKVLLILCLVLLAGCVKKTSDILVFNVREFENFKLDSMCEKAECSLLFKDEKIDFGEIDKKDVSKILIHFPYANIGYSKLVLFNADVSCNCLTATYSACPLSRESRCNRGVG